MRRIGHCLGLWLCLAWCCAVLDAAETTIVAFGDSTTAPRASVVVYATLLQDDLTFSGNAVRVVNAGVPGNTTAMAKKRFEKDVLDRHPDLVVIQFGINDSAVDVWKKPPATGPRVPLTDYEANLRGFIAALQQRGIRPVLMTPNPLRWRPKLRERYGQTPYQVDEAEGMNVLLRDYAATVRRIADEEHVGLVDVFDRFLPEGQKAGLDDEQLLPDGMHPSSDGHRIVARLLIDRLSALDARFHGRSEVRETPSGP